jgi:hypothetical protein
MPTTVKRHPDISKTTLPSSPRIRASIKITEVRAVGQLHGHLMHGRVLDCDFVALVFRPYHSNRLTELGDTRICRLELRDPSLEGFAAYFDFLWRIPPMNFKAKQIVKALCEVLPRRTPPDEHEQSPLLKRGRGRPRKRLSTSDAA